MLILVNIGGEDRYQVIVGDVLVLDVACDIGVAVDRTAQGMSARRRSSRVDADLRPIRPEEQRIGAPAVLVADAPVRGDAAKHRRLGTVEWMRAARLRGRIAAQFR